MNTPHRTSNGLERLTADGWTGLVAQRYVHSWREQPLVTQSSLALFEDEAQADGWKVGSLNDPDVYISAQQAIDMSFNLNSRVPQESAIVSEGLELLNSFSNAQEILAHEWSIPQNERPHKAASQHVISSSQSSSHERGLAQDALLCHDQSISNDGWRVKGDAPPKPPNYRRATKRLNAPHCGSCKMYEHGKCWGYGNISVEEDAVCDSYALSDKSQHKQADKDQNVNKQVDSAFSADWGDLDYKLTFFDDNASWSTCHEGAEKDELFIALNVPKPTADEIYAWVKEQDWPEGTELEDPEDYHITLIYSSKGYKEHKEAEWWATDNSDNIKVQGIDEFPSQPSQEKANAFVLRVDTSGDEIKHRMDRLLDEAESHGIEVNRYPGGSKPHITVAYGPKLPDGLEPPHLSFSSDEAHCGSPRTSGLKGIESGVECDAEEWGIADSSSGHLAISQGLQRSSNDQMLSILEDDGDWTAPKALIPLNDLGDGFAIGVSNNFHEVPQLSDQSFSNIETNRRQEVSDAFFAACEDEETGEWDSYNKCGASQDKLNNSQSQYEWENNISHNRSMGENDITINRYGKAADENDNPRDESRIDGEIMFPVKLANPEATYNNDDANDNEGYHIIPSHLFVDNGSDNKGDDAHNSHGPIDKSKVFAIGNDVKGKANDGGQAKEANEKHHPNPNFHDFHNSSLSDVEWHFNGEMLEQDQYGNNAKSLEDDSMLLKDIENRDEWRFASSKNPCAYKSADGMLDLNDAVSQHFQIPDLFLDPHEHRKVGHENILAKPKKIRNTEKPHKCEYCKEPATKSILWAEGMAFIPVCDKHEQKARKHVGEDEVCAVHQIKSSVVDSDARFGWTSPIQDTVDGFKHNYLPRVQSDAQPLDSVDSLPASDSSANDIMRFNRWSIHKPSIARQSDYVVNPSTQWAHQPTEGLYHAAPSSERERIKAHGLQPAQPGLNPHWEKAFNESEFVTPNGVYGFPDREDAREQAQWMEENKGQAHDIWRIAPHESLMPLPDPEENGAWVVQDPVHNPELIERAEDRLLPTKGLDLLSNHPRQSLTQARIHEEALSHIHQSSPSDELLLFLKENPKEIEDNAQKHEWNYEVNSHQDENHSNNGHKNGRDEFAHENPFVNKNRRIADSWDTRQWPDPLSDNGPQPNHPKGCTCDLDHKLDCPVHGLNAPVVDTMEWSIPEASPVGYPQDQPRNWTQAVSAVHMGDTIDKGAHNTEVTNADNPPHDFTISPMIGNKRGQQDKAQTNSQSNKDRPKQGTNNSTEANKYEWNKVNSHEPSVSHIHSFTDSPNGESRPSFKALLTSDGIRESIEKSESDFDNGFVLKSGASEPYVAQMWHGSNRGDLGPIRPGFFATTHLPQAEDYAGMGIGLEPQDEGRTHRVTVNFRNPLHYNGSWPGAQEAIRQGHANGNDGVVIHFPEDNRDKWEPVPAHDWAYVLDPSAVTMGHQAAGPFSDGTGGWEVVEAGIDPADSHMHGVGGREFTHSPWVADPLTNRIYLGQQGVHHADITNRYGIPLTDWGHVNNGGIYVGEGSHDQAEAIKRHLGPGFAIDERDPDFGESDESWNFNGSRTANVKIEEVDAPVVYPPDEFEGRARYFVNRRPLVYYAPQKTVYMGPPGSEHGGVYDYLEHRHPDWLPEHVHEGVVGKDGVEFFDDNSSNNEGYPQEASDAIVQHTGVPEKPGIDKEFGWHFDGSYRKSHNLTWEPGSSGKGLFDREGNLHTWSVDESSKPWHSDYIRDILGESASEYPYFQSAFYINPKGGLSGGGRKFDRGLLDRAEGIDPRLQSTESPSHEWDFNSKITVGGVQFHDIPEEDWSMPNHWSGRVPTYYDPKTDMIHVGPYGTHHQDVTDAAMGGRFAEGGALGNFFEGGAGESDDYEPIFGNSAHHQRAAELLKANLLPEWGFNSKISTVAVQVHEIGEPTFDGSRFHGERRPFTYIQHMQNLFLGPPGGDHYNMMKGKHFVNIEEEPRGGVYTDPEGKKVVEFYSGAPEPEHVQGIVNALGADRAQLNEWHVGDEVHDNPDYQWNFNSKTSQEGPTDDELREIDEDQDPYLDSIGETPWQPGLTGKGMYWPSHDRLETWADPRHHVDIWKEGNEAPGHALGIGPNGDVWHEGSFGSDEEDNTPLEDIAEAIRRHDPRLIPRRMNSDYQYNFNSAWKFAHVLNWEPGQYGKGLIHNGEVHTWPTEGWDGAPSHPDYAKKNIELPPSKFPGNEWIMSPTWDTAFSIDPQGHATIYDPEKAGEIGQQIEAADPNLRVNYNRDYGWNFGPTEPMRTEPDSEDEKRLHNVEISNNEPGVSTVDA